MNKKLAFFGLLLLAMFGLFLAYRAPVSPNQGVGESTKRGDCDFLKTSFSNLYDVQDAVLVRGEEQKDGQNGYVYAFIDGREADLNIFPTNYEYAPSTSSVAKSPAFETNEAKLVPVKGTQGLYVAITDITPTAVRPPDVTRSKQTSSIRWQEKAGQPMMTLSFDFHAGSEFAARLANSVELTSANNIKCKTP